MHVSEPLSVRGQGLPSEQNGLSGQKQGERPHDAQWESSGDSHLQRCHKGQPKASDLDYASGF